MKRRVYRRVQSAVIAAAMVFTMLPVGALRASAAPENPKISFINGDNGDPNKASVITGRSVDLREVVGSGYVPEEILINGRKKDDIDKPPIKGITISPNGNKQTVNIDAKFHPKDLNITGNPEESIKNTLVLQGNYYALLAEGSVTETNPFQAPMGGTVRSSTQKAITETSRITIKCIKAETSSAPPQFEIDTNDISGSFEKFKNGKIVIDECSKDAAKPKVLRFTLLNDKGENASFEMNPQFKYNYVTKLPDSPKDTGEPADPLTPKEVDNYIRMGTTFTLSFTKPQSNELFLTVYTPQAAMSEIESQIAQSDGLGDSSYVKLKEGNSLDYITENFEVRRKTTQFNAPFSIKWEWEPEKPEHKKVVQLGGGNTEWQTVKINPLEDDVKGFIQATVYYKMPGGGEQETVTTTLPKKDILIRGIGKPVEVTQLRETTKNGVENFTDDKTKLPEIKDLDAYKGDITGYKVEPKGPYEYTLKLNMGAKNGAAKYAVVNASGYTDGIELQTKYGTGQAMDYTAGTEIKNEEIDPGIQGEVELIILPQRLPQDIGQQTVKLDISFFIPDRSGKPVESSRKFSITLRLHDGTPSQDSSLKDFVIVTDSGEKIEFSFKSDQYLYSGPNMIHLPYSTKSFTIMPVYNDVRGSKSPTKLTWSTGGQPTEAYNQKKTDPIKTRDVNEVYTLEATVPSQDPRQEFWTTYKFEFVRDPASRDSSLKSIGIYLPEDKEKANNLLTNFNPEQTEYRIEVPYGTDVLRVLYEQNHKRATSKVEPELEGANIFDKQPQWLKGLRKKFQNTTEQDGAILLKFNVVAESGEAGDTTTYTVHIYRQDPSDDPTLKELKVLDKEEKELEYKPAFNPENEVYRVDIPYSTKEIKLNVTPNYPKVENIRVYSNAEDALDSSKLILEMKKNEGITLFKGDSTLKPGIPTSKIPVFCILDAEVKDKGYHPFYIEVTAEDMQTKKGYILQVVREEPSTDASLSSLVLKDQEAADIRTFAFHPDETDYKLEVPFETEGISFTPTSANPNAIIKVKEPDSIISLGTVVPSGDTSKVYKLKEPGKESSFVIEVTAEDGKTIREYAIKVTRKMPSSDARLKDLKVDNIEKLEPKFLASITRYSAMVSEGAKGVVITPTANAAGATIRVNGEVVASGTASQLIEFIEVRQKVDVEVTAQDGKTKMTYTIEFTDQNLIEKTSNADLRSLTLNSGQMSPQFKPGVTEYEVAVTENTHSIDIVPVPSDPFATMRVLAGSKEIGDYNNNYSQALVDGENPINIEVTSPDKKVVKNYSLKIYRNEKDKMQNLKPLEADQIDFKNSENPIIVMIDEYPRIGASVFNELRKYPEKTIIFQGNDYSLEFKASELTRVIPNAEVYDFRMSFTSPEESKVLRKMERYKENDDLVRRMVFVYFEDHKTLPGPAIFRLSLGKKYSNETLYWHYYNTERDRIDYYGEVNSNNRGNIALYLDHFSTYMLTKHHSIVGAENKSEDIDYNMKPSNNKRPPNTGAEEK